MTIVKHELRQGRMSLMIWTATIAFMMGICILIFPDMSSDMGDLGRMFSDMGSFSAAFGMDKINFGEFTGFFAVECGNILGLGGAFYAAYIGIMALSKEEKEHTAEFLLSHPVSRTRIVAEKLLAVFLQILVLNAVTAAVTAAGIMVIREEVQAETMVLLLAAYLLMQIETAAVSFGISAFLSRSGPGIGIGLAALLYFLNIAANLTEKLKFLKYITPFGYTDGAEIIAEGALQTGFLATGMVLGAAGLISAFWYYIRKDIVS